MPGTLLRPRAAASLAAEQPSCRTLARREASWPPDAPQIISSRCVISAGLGVGVGIRDAPIPGGEAQKTWLQANQVESAKTQRRKEQNVPYLIRAGASGWSSEPWGGMRKKVASRGSWPSVGHAVEGNSTWKPALLQREQPGMSSGKSCMADFREVDRECGRGTLGAGREESVHWLRQGEGNLGLGFAGSEEESAMASGWRSS